MKVSLELHIKLRKRMQFIQEEIQEKLEVYENWGANIVSGKQVKGMKRFIEEDVPTEGRKRRRKPKTPSPGLELSPSQNDPADDANDENDDDDSEEEEEDDEEEDDEEEDEEEDEEGEEEDAEEENDDDDESATSSRVGLSQHYSSPKKSAKPKKDRKAKKSKKGKSSPKRKARKAKKPPKKKARKD